MDISKEVAALEQLFEKENNNYYATPTLQGKKWYGIGLEDNEANSEKDDTNKRGVIGRLIDYIVTFIGRIIKKVKEFFTGKKDNDPNKVFKEYDGPSDSAKAKAFAEHTRTMDEMNERAARRDKEHAERMAKMEKEGADAQKEHEEDMARSAAEDKKYKYEQEEARKTRMKNAELADKLVKSTRERDIIRNNLNEISKQTGKVMSVAEIEEAIEKRLVAQFFTDSGKSYTANFAASLSDDYAKHYKLALASYENISKAITNNQTPSNDDSVIVTDSVKELKKIRELHKDDGKDELWDTMVKVLNNDTSLLDWAALYIRDLKIDSILDACTEAQNKLKSIKETATKEEVSLWRDAIIALSDFSMITLQIHTCAEKIANTLNRFK